MNRFRLTCFLMIAVAYCSCNSSSLRNMLQQADRFMKNDPDSAFALLSSYPAPETLNEADFAAYQLMYTKAKDKSYMDLLGDTAAILRSVVYYKEHGNASQKGWSNYYAGRVYTEADKLFESGLYFLKAAEYAGEIPDPILGMMANYFLGGLHDKQYAFDKSLDAYKTSYAIYSKTHGEKYTGALLHSIGSEYGINGNRDSAYFYLDKALAIACEHKDTVGMAAIYNDIGLYLKEDSQYPKAKYCLQLSLSMETDSSWMINQKTTLAEIHANMNELDSAFFLLKEVRSVVEASNDIRLQAVYYSALAETEAANKNFEVAYLNQKRYVTCVDSIYQFLRKSSLAETEQIYNYIRYQDENEVLQHKQSQIILFVCLLIGMLIVVVMLIGWVSRQRKQALSNAEETIETLRKMQKESHNSIESKEVGEKKLSDYSDEEKEKTVKKALLMQLNIAKMLAQLDEKSDKDKTFLEKFNRLFYGEQRTPTVNWEELNSLINLLYDDFSDTLQRNYAAILVEKEIQLCCLLKANMDTTEIACVMGQSINTVRTRKTSIRKKLNAPDAADIITVLEEKLKNKG